MDTTKKRFLLLFSQALWHLLYLLSLTVWSGIPVIPRFAATSEILDKTRWFWLMDAPHSGVQHGLLISDMMQAAALIELLVCFVWLCLYLRKNWKNSSRKTKGSYVVIILMGLLISVLFQRQMRLHFLNMTAYHFMWQRDLNAEILAIVIAAIALTGSLSHKKKPVFD